MRQTPGKEASAAIGVHGQWICIDVGKGNGRGLDVGAYYSVARPAGAADWPFRLSVKWVFP